MNGEEKSIPTVTPDSFHSTTNSSSNMEHQYQPHHAHHTDLEDYFKGPRDPYRHSKLPFFLRMHGSVLPKMIVPLFFLACWTTAITTISMLVHSLGIESELLTVLGFVVGLSLSFRSSTAYERYSVQFHLQEYTAMRYVLILLFCIGRSKILVPAPLEFPHPSSANMGARHRASHGIR